MITKADFASLTDDLQSIFNEVAQTKVADMRGNKIFDVTSTERLTFDHLVLHGMAGIQKVAEGQDLPRITSQEGDSITWTQAYYGAIAPITDKMRRFDLYDQIESLIKSLSIDAFDKIDQSYADVLLYGWANSHVDVYGATRSGLGPDSIMLFNTSHSNNINDEVFTNIIDSNKVLSRASINVARIAALTHKDPEGIMRPINLDTLIIPPSLEDLAERILLSSNISGSANNDINPLKGKIKNIIVWERLEERSDGTDTSAYWFLADSSKVGESLKSKFAKKPVLDAPEQVYSNKNWDYSCDFYYTLGIGYPAYVWGSNGNG